MQDPSAGARIGLDPRRVEDFGGQVAAEETPFGAIGGGTDVMLVTGDYLIGEEGWRAVGEDGAVLYQSFVGK